MTYTKPELVALTHAVEAIQGSSNKPPASFLDANEKVHDATHPAYEADE